MNVASCGDSHNSSASCGAIGETSCSPNFYYVCQAEAIVCSRDGRGATQMLERSVGSSD
jgi:hypothetical protein